MIQNLKCLMKYRVKISCFVYPVTPSFCGAEQGSCFLTYLSKDIFYAHIKQICVYSSPHFVRMVAYFTCLDPLYFLEYEMVFKL